MACLDGIASLIHPPGGQKLGYHLECTASAADRRAEAWICVECTASCRQRSEHILITMKQMSDLS
eukprot:scaffold78417_cov17-Tisochrysis_lutea.AAC.3